MQISCIQECMMCTRVMGWQGLDGLSHYIFKLTKHVRVKPGAAASIGFLVHKAATPCCQL
jgi:hypothetical protein